MDFEWDESKELANVQRHGLSFAEAVECFLDPKGIALVDARHSVNEKRFYWVGKNAAGRILTTGYTRRGKHIRIIGWGEWRKFRRLYDEGAKAG